jgi:hypothetical protein
VWVAALIVLVSLELSYRRSGKRCHTVYRTAQVIIVGLVLLAYNAFTPVSHAHHVSFELRQAILGTGVKEQLMDPEAFAEHRALYKELAYYSDWLWFFEHLPFYVFCPAGILIFAGHLANGRKKGGKLNLFATPFVHRN